MRSYFVYSVCFLLVSHALHAQIRISANPTGRHQELIDQAKKGKKIYEFAKQQQLDSVAIIKADTSLTRKEKRKQIKALKKRYKAERKKAKQLAKERIEEETGVYLPDSITYPPRTSDDSLKWALQVLANEGDIDEIQKIRAAYSAVDTLSTDNLGYAAAKRSEKIAESFLPEEIRSLEQQQPELPDPNQLFMKDLPDDQLPHRRLDELLEKAPEGAIDDAVVTLSNLKSKYTEIPDVRFPEKGVKKNSLKGQGIRKRIVPGGNIALQSTDPVVLDVDLQLGFRLNKKWVAGTGIVWRESFAKEDSLSGNRVDNAHGYSAFTSYKVISNFFLYSEYQGMKNRALFNPAELDEDSRWQYQWLIGIGNEITLFRFLNLTMILTYDLNHKNNDLHSRPFVFKVGYRVSGLPFGKK